MAMKMTQTDAGGKVDTYRKYRKRGLADLDASGSGAKKMMGRAGAAAPDFQNANQTNKFQRQTLMGE